MQVERHHIRGGEGVLRQIGQQEFIDNSVTGEPDLALLLFPGWGWMSGHDDTNERSSLGQALVWAVVERVADSTFCTKEVLIGRQVQARLDVGAIEDAVVFAASDIREIVHIADDRPGAILAIEAQQCSLGGKVVGLEVRLDGRLCSAQFLAILSIARVAKAGHPLMGMHLQDRRARANDFPSLASGVARRAEGTQTPLGRRPIRRLRERPLTRCFTCPINIEDEPAVPLPIPESGCMLLRGKTACQQIFKKERPQGLHWFSGQGG